MKNMDSNGLKICSFQAALFERSVSHLNCSSKIFVRRFMHSALASRLDSNGYCFEATGIEDAFDELEQQYGTGYVGYGAMGEMSADFALSWSLSQYRNSLSAAKADDAEAEDAWDELEKSVVASLAKDVTVGVKKEQVEMKVLMEIKDV